MRSACLCEYAAPSHLGTLARHPAQAYISSWHLRIRRYLPVPCWDRSNYCVCLISTFLICAPGMMPGEVSYPPRPQRTPHMVNRSIPSFFAYIWMARTDAGSSTYFFQPNRICVSSACVGVDCSRMLPASYGWCSSVQTACETAHVRYCREQLTDVVELIRAHVAQAGGFTDSGYRNCRAA